MRLSVLLDNSVAGSSSDHTSSLELSPSPASGGSSSGSDTTIILESTKARKRQLIEGPPDSNTARNVSNLQDMICCNLRLPITCSFVSILNIFKFENYKNKTMVPLMIKWDVVINAKAIAVDADHFYTFLVGAFYEFLPIVISDRQSSLVFKAKRWSSI